MVMVRPGHMPPLFFALHCLSQLNSAELRDPLQEAVTNLWLARQRGAASLEANEERCPLLIHCIHSLVVVPGEADYPWNKTIVCGGILTLRNPT